MRSTVATSAAAVAALQSVVRAGTVGSVLTSACQHKTVFSFYRSELT